MIEEGMKEEDDEEDDSSVKDEMILGQWMLPQKSRI